MQVIPALLTSTTEELYQQIHTLSPYFQRFQIDIADGIFVPNSTVQLETLLNDCQNWDDIIKKTCIFDFHLMVDDYEKEIELIKKIHAFLNVDTVFVHLSRIIATQHIINEESFHIGVVLNPENSVDTLQHNVSTTDINAIQIMTVHPGFQGQPFLPEQLEKIKELRLIGYNGKIFIDGGVNDKSLLHIKQLEYKPDFLCIGSYLTHAENITDRLTMVSALD